MAVTLIDFLEKQAIGIDPRQINACGAAAIPIDLRLLGVLRFILEYQLRLKSRAVGSWSYLSRQKWTRPE